MRSKHPKLRNVGRYISAGGLLFLGILGCVLPFAPGIPFLLAGVYLVNPEWYKRNYKKLKGKLKQK